MTKSSDGGGNDDELPEEDRRATYGQATTVVDQVLGTIERKRDFKPWHHPVKQIVRERQWAALTTRLIKERFQFTSKLRYFTLPGPDLLDVQVLAGVCAPLGVQIEYFGFDVNAGPEAATEVEGAYSQGAWINAESALRQAGRIADEAVILPDRLEDLAIDESQASSQLRQRATFDVVNIDACDHLAYHPKGRDHNTFDALGALLKHQMSCRTPWLLFITTRAEPGLLGAPGVQFQHAITQNLGISGNFASTLADCIDADPGKLATALAAGWGKHDLSFMKLYSVGLGKFLLQFFHMQPSFPANVELASCYAYRVHNEEPDMLALAFRISPDPTRIYPPNVGGAAVVPFLEPNRAAYIASQAKKLQDLDHALAVEPDIRNAAVDGTVALLAAANYDMDAYKQWLASHHRRPMVIGDAD